MLKLYSLQSIALASIAFLAGCATEPLETFKRHAMTITGDGDILAPNAGTELLPSAGSQLTPLHEEQFAAYVDEMFTAVRGDERAKNLLIFVHGGLNTISSSTGRSNALIEAFNRKELGDYYPLQINWDSGFFNTYKERLFKIRQGESKPLIAVASSPFYLSADLGRGIVRAPIDIANTTYRDVQAIPWIQQYANKFKVNSDLLYNAIKKDYSSNVSLGIKRPAGAQTFIKIPVNVLTWPFQLVLSPIIDAFGAPAWEEMQRRAKVLYNKPQQFDIDMREDRIPAVLEGGPASAMSLFAERLEAFCRDRPDAEVTLVGHSMGTFIINQMLRRYPTIRVNNIVYMAGADSIRNTFESVLPYMSLKGHEKTRFFNLTLHPQSEVEEVNYYFAPRGSLLVWITDFFSTPHTQFDRTVGRWEDIIQAYGQIDSSLRHRVYIKAFDETSKIAEHGDFARARFWKEEFWRPGEDNSNPWPKSGSAESGFYQMK